MKSLSVILILMFNCITAQVAIGKTSVSGNNSILEFAGNTTDNLPTNSETTNFKGIILPGVTASPTFSNVNPSTNNPQNGTFIFDRQLQRIRMYENGVWINLSETGSAAGMVPATGMEQEAGVIIGASTSNATGVLVLESSNKAIILPHIKNPHTTVKSPYPGMMCYDTFSNSVAFYDGANWNYWK